MSRGTKKVKVVNRKNEGVKDSASGEKAEKVANEVVKRFLEKGMLRSQNEPGEKTQL
jgi:hypothetical protein